MGNRLSGFSGNDVVQILQKEFLFYIVGQRGSHVKLCKTEEDGTTVTTVVPNHSELAPGTLRGILKQAHVGVLEFLEKK